jgi:hypothetical protein
MARWPLYRGPSGPRHRAPQETPDVRTISLTWEVGRRSAGARRAVPGASSPRGAATLANSPRAVTSKFIGTYGAPRASSPLRQGTGTPASTPGGPAQSSPTIGLLSPSGGGTSWNSAGRAWRCCTSRKTQPKNPPETRGNAPGCAVRPLRGSQGRRLLTPKGFDNTARGNAPGHRHHGLQPQPGEGAVALVPFAHLGSVHLPVRRRPASGGRW